MIDKAFGLQEACRNAMFDEGVRRAAFHVLQSHMMMTEDEMKEALFALMSELTAQSSYQTTLVLLDENQQEELAHTIDMLNAVGGE